MASTKMTLLIPHAPGLTKRRHFGVTDEEFQVRSVHLRTEVTHFALAARIALSDCDKDRCDELLRTMRKYNVLHSLERRVNSGRDGCKPMSARIFADIGRRGITYPRDILPIAANSCSHDIRLPAKDLTHHSLSLCILAQFLLNGEILDMSSDSKAESNIFDFLESKALSMPNVPGPGESPDLS